MIPVSAKLFEKPATQWRWMSTVRIRGNPMDKDKPLWKAKGDQCWFAGAHADVGGGYKRENYPRFVAMDAETGRKKPAKIHVSSADRTRCPPCKMHTRFVILPLVFINTCPSVYEHYRPLGLALTKRFILRLIYDDPRMGRTRLTRIQSTAT